MKRSKKHKKITTDYEKIKSKHLENLATKILKRDEKLNSLKSKTINKDFLDNF